MTNEDALAMLPMSFWRRFTVNLVNTFECDIFAKDDDGCPSVFYLMSTYGWTESFRKALRSLRYRKLRKWYEDIEWYESDAFDSDVAEKLMEWREKSGKNGGKDCTAVNYVIWSVTEGKGFM